MNKKIIFVSVLMIIIVGIGIYYSKNKEFASVTYVPNRSQLFFEKVKCADVITESSFNSIFKKDGWVLDDRFFVSNGACSFRPTEWKVAMCDAMAINECDKWKGVDSTKLIECSKTHQAVYKDRGCNAFSSFTISISPFDNSEKYKITLQNLRTQVGNSSRLLEPANVKNKLVESNNVGSYYFDYDTQESISARFITTDNSFYVTLLFMPTRNYDNAFNRDSIRQLATLMNEKLTIIANQIISKK